MSMTATHKRTKEISITTFAINGENNIVAFTAIDEAAQAADPTATAFHSEEAFAELSVGWPMSRFVEIWNSLPRQTPVKRFTDQSSRWPGIARKYRRRKMQPGAAEVPGAGNEERSSLKLRFLRKVCTVTKCLPDSLFRGSLIKQRTAQASSLGREFVPSDVAPVRCFAPWTRFDYKLHDWLLNANAAFRPFSLLRDQTSTVN